MTHPIESAATNPGVYVFRHLPNLVHFITCFGFRLYGVFITVS
jgi:hypothetical protein